MPPFAFIGTLLLAMLANGLPTMGLMFAAPMIQALKQAQAHRAMMWVGHVADGLMKLQVVGVPLAYLAMVAIYVAVSRGVASVAVKYMFLLAMFTVVVMVLVLVLSARLDQQ
jgi:hypothetical protein